MKYLELDILNPVNYFLSHLDTNDGSRIYGRVEAYSCKSAGNDKKLYKRMKSEGVSAAKYSGDVGIPVFSPTRTLFYLITCLNQIFPDHDFRFCLSLIHSGLTMENFVERRGGMYPIIESVDTTLFNAGLTSNMFQMKDFSHKFWGCLDAAINFKNCQIYSYIPDVDSDPFAEEHRRCM